MTSAISELPFQPRMAYAWMREINDLVKLLSAWVFGLAVAPVPLFIQMSDYVQMFVLRKKEESSQSLCVWRVASMGRRAISFHFCFFHPGILWLRFPSLWLLTLSLCKMLESSCHQDGLSRTVIHIPVKSKHCSPMMGCNGYQQDTDWALKSDNLCSSPGSVTY